MQELAPLFIRFYSTHPNGDFSIVTVMENLAVYYQIISKETMRVTKRGLTIQAGIGIQGLIVPEDSSKASRLDVPEFY